MLHPQDVHVLHPSVAITEFSLHSGHLVNLDEVSATDSLEASFIVAAVAPLCAASIARPIASGQEITLILGFFILAITVVGHLIPFSWWIISSISTPDRSAILMSRAVASLCDGQPPALPRCVKTSHIPASSLLTVTNNVPHPILYAVVVPATTCARVLGLDLTTDSAFCCFQCSVLDYLDNRRDKQ